MRDVAWLALLLACSGGKDLAYDTGGPSETDADADSDSDSDADTDTDSTADGDGDGYSVAQGDCDDTDATIHPDAYDAPYDGIDADCAGDSDDDADGDGYDDLGHGGDDCDDTDVGTHPGASEFCDGQDDDCDLVIDDTPLDGQTFYADLDGDGHGDAGAPIVACALPPYAATTADDCDDGAATVYPGAPDVACDGLDDDCDVLTVEVGAVLLDGSPVADLATALAAASTGSLVELCEGLYAAGGSIVGRGVTITGLGGSATTLLDAGGGPLLVVTTTEPVTLDGLTLTGGEGRPVGRDTLGGGLYVGDGGDVTAIDLVVTGNRAANGAGVYLGVGASLSLTASAIDVNTGDLALAFTFPIGGGIYTEDDAAISLTTTTIDLNSSDECGGLRLGRNVTVVGDGLSTIDGNAATGLDGGGVCAWDGAALTDLTISNNTTPNAGGGISGSDVLLDGVTVTTNDAGLDGGGLAVGGTNALSACTITDNVAGILGGGMDLGSSTTTVVIEDSVVTGNEAQFGFATDGGGAHLYQAVLQSVNTDWGTGALDNLPVDIELDDAGVTYSYGAAASFTCDDGASGTCL